MSNQQNQSNEDIMARFTTLINSSIPEEYKQLLTNFQEQGHFYTQLLQSISNDKDFSSFWDIPTTLGFANTATENHDWFTPFYDINGYSAKTKDKLGNHVASIIENFTHQAQERFQTFQTALQKMSVLHTQINQQAMIEFNRLKESSEDTSNDILCQHWLQAGELAFNNVSQQPEYITAQRELFESIGALQADKENLYEQFSTMMGLPSAKAQCELTQALHNLRLDFAEYKEKTDAQLHLLQQQLNKKS